MTNNLRFCWWKWQCQFGSRETTKHYFTIFFNLRHIFKAVILIFYTRQNLQQKLSKISICKYYKPSIAFLFSNVVGVNFFSVFGENYICLLFWSDFIKDIHFYLLFYTLHKNISIYALFERNLFSKEYSFYTKIKSTFWGFFPIYFNNNLFFLCLFAFYSLGRDRHPLRHAWSVSRL